MPSIQHVFFLPSARINSLLVADLLLDALAERRPGYEGGVGRALGAVHLGHQETQRSLKKKSDQFRESRIFLSLNTHVIDVLK